MNASIKTNQLRTNQQSFHQTLLIWFLLLALVPMLLVSILGYQSAQKSLQEAASQQLKLASSTDSEFINSWFSFRFKDILSQAEAPATRKLFISLQKLRKTTDTPLKSFVKSFKWVQTSSSLETPIALFMHHYDYVSNAYLIDLNGNIIYSKKRQSDLGQNLFNSTLKNTSFAKTVRASQTSGQTLFSDIERYAPNSNHLVGFISTPLLNEKGEKIGVFALQIRLDAVFSHLKIDYQGNHTLKHYLVGTDGFLRSPINSTDDILKTSIKTKQFQLWHEEYQHTNSSLTNSNELAFEYTGPSGSLVIGIHQAINIGGVNWALISEIDSDEAFAASTTVKELTFILALITSIAVVILASYQSRRITRPLTHLINTIGTVKNGNIDERAAVETKNEIGVLADAFNDLLDNQQQFVITEQKNNKIIQETLDALEEQKFVLDQHAIVSITDVQGNITLINDKFCAISGYNRDELIGSNHRILNSSHHDTAFFKDMYHTIANGKVWEGEICNKAKNGRLYWVRSTIMATMGADEKPQSYIAIRTDITSVKEAENNAKKLTQQITESKERLDLVMDSTGVGIWDWQILSGQVEFNERWAEITGHTLEELEPLNMTTWIDQFHPDDLSLSSQVMEKHFDGEINAYEVEVRLKHKHGHWIWVLDSGRLVERDESGSPKRMIGTLLDISKRKQAELDTLEALSITDATLESTNNGIVVSDTESNTLFFNSNLISMWNLPLEAMDEKGSRNITQLMIQQVQQPDSFSEQIVSCIKDHSLSLTGSLTLLDNRAFEFDSKPLIRNEEITGRVWRFTDVSERLAVELEIIEAKEAAETASRTKSQFLANMSHEIRTPMNGVLGMTELLLDNPLDEAQQSRAQTIKRSADSLLTIINDILDFSKIEAGKLDLEIIDFNLADLIEDVADTFTAQAEDNQIEFICSANPSIPPWYKGDPGRLRQILTNLISNAIKFTKEGEVSLQYSQQQLSNGKSTLRFTVKDSGIGLSVAQQQNLFQKFSQADNSITRKFGGTGLGLAICKQLIELMHGEIGVTSDPNKGSTFWFTVELNETENKNPALNTASLHEHRLLVVDDNATNRQIFNDFLNAWKIPHDVTDSGTKAIQMLQQAASEGSPYTVALIDMQMPEMNGADLGAAIRNDNTIANTRLALLTSQGKRGDAKKMHSSGFSAYLTKPIRQSQLYNALLQMVATQVGEVPATLVTQYTTRKQQLHFDAKVLVVDDNGINQAVACGMLGKYGIDADIANNGQEAIDLLTHTGYDLVFMDCQMPIMDGYTATQKIRDPNSRVKDHRIPVIAMTANAMIGDREKCLDAGMNGFLAKPVDSSQLQKQLQKWIGNKLIDVETYKNNCSKNSSPAATDSSSEQNTIVFDYDAISERLMDDIDLIKTIIDAFLTDMPVQIQLLKGFITSGDIKQSVAQAHKIKGSSASVGAIALSAIACKIEKSENLDTLQNFYTDIEPAFEELKDAIKEKLT